MQKIASQIPLPLQIGLALVMILIGVAEAGVASKVIWALVGMLGGILAGAWLIYEAIMDKKGLFSKICLYAAGFILLLEVVYLVLLIISRGW
jgi:hypothetical protein